MEEKFQQLWAPSAWSTEEKVGVLPFPAVTLTFLKETTFPASNCHWTLELALPCVWMLSVALLPTPPLSLGDLFKEAPMLPVYLPPRSLLPWPSAILSWCELAYFCLSAHLS